MKTHVFVTAFSLTALAGCSSGSNASALGPEMTGVASKVVHSCPYDPRFNKPAPMATTMPSAVSTTYGVRLPSGVSFFGVQAGSPHGDIPYFFVGPVGAACRVIYAGDGGEDMSAIDSHDNAEISEELYPSGMPAGDEIACYVFPDMGSDPTELGHPCPKDGKIETWNLPAKFTSSDKSNLELSESVGLAKIAQGDAPEYLSNVDSASSQYTTWQLSLFGMTMHWIACSVPQKDSALCVGAFQYFLAETAAIDGLELSNQNAIGTLIQDHIRG